MMCHACCLSSSVSCAAIVLLAFRLLIRLTHPSRSSPRRACRASLRPVSSRCLDPSHLIRFAFLLVSLDRLIRSSCLLSLCSLASLCLLSPSLVSPGGASLVSLSSRHAFRLSSLRACLPSCVPLILGLQLWMSSPCSCVPLLLCRLCPVSLVRSGASFVVFVLYCVPWRWRPSD